MSRLKHPATIIAMVALFAAFSGGAVAGTLISGSQIRNHTIPAKKLTRSAVRELRGRRGPAGPRGVGGSRGRLGLQASPRSPMSRGPSAICAHPTACSVVSVTAPCPSGSYVVGGSANADVIDAHISTFAGSVTYRGVADNASTLSGTFTVTAVCASGPGLRHAAAKTSTLSSEMSNLKARLRSQRLQAAR